MPHAFEKSPPRAGCLLPMSTLSIFANDQGRTALHRSGWSWLAALSLPLWALRRNLWRTLAALLIALPLLLVALDVVIKTIAAERTQGWLALASVVAWSIACAALANRWHLRCLRRAGYRLIATEAQP
jgi:hypothetical protein